MFLKWPEPRTKILPPRRPVSQWAPGTWCRDIEAWGFPEVVLTVVEHIWRHISCPKEPIELWSLVVIEIDINFWAHSCDSMAHAWNANTHTHARMKLFTHRCCNACVCVRVPHMHKACTINDVAEIHAHYCNDNSMCMYYDIILYISNVIAIRFRQRSGSLYEHMTFCNHQIAGPLNVPTWIGW